MTKVDQEFQSRKEEAIQLSWKVSELQGQLDYVSRINEEETQANASRDARLSWLTKQCEYAKTAISKLDKDSILPLQELFNFFQLVHSTGNKSTSFLII